MIVIMSVCVRLQMAEYFPPEDLEQCGAVLEQSVSHNDHNTYRSLPG